MQIGQWHFKALIVLPGSNKLVNSTVVIPKKIIGTLHHNSPENFLSENDGLLQLVERYTMMEHSWHTVGMECTGISVRRFRG